MSTLSEAEREMLAFFYEEDDEHFEARVAAVESIVAARVEAALAEVRRIYDLQCPVMPAENYTHPSARVAHLWWQRVLGGALDRLAAPAPTPEPCRWTNGGAPACSETRDERYWCEPCRERREVGA